jgi:hypothetical protein
MLLLDVEMAFDSVWHNALFQIYATLPVASENPLILEIIDSYL